LPEWVLALLLEPVLLQESTVPILLPDFADRVAVREPSRR
jgi:hypothetical protein